MKDTWRKVPGYENYEISIDTKEGKCRNIKTGKILSNKPGKRGYIGWNLYGNPKHGTNHQAAKWIALTYPELIENEYFDGAQIDHKDTDKLNNQPSNLHWVDCAGQQNNPLTKQHISKSLTGKHTTEETRKKMRDSHKGKRPWMLNNRSISKSVKQYDLNGEFIKEYPSAAQAQRETGIWSTNILATCNGYPDHATAGGYVWKFV